MPKFPYKLNRAIAIMERNSENENLPKDVRDLCGQISYWLKDYRKLKEESEERDKK